MPVTDLTDEKICNIALTRVGGLPIYSIQEPQDDREASCSLLYFITLDQILSEHDWNFARHEQDLTYDTDQPRRGGFKRAFRLPADLVAGPFSVSGDGRKINIGDYRCFGAHLYADYTLVTVEYRRRPPCSLWPAYFTNLFSNALSGQFSVPERDNVKMAQYYEEIAFGPASMNRRGGLFSTAAKLDAQARPTKTMFRNGDPLTGARR